VNVTKERIEIFFRKRDYKCIIRNTENLLKHQQYEELSREYSILGDIAINNAIKFEEIYAQSHNAEDLNTAERWKDACSIFGRRIDGQD
jgi:tRNA G37 N-methylase Trm5